MVLLFSCCPGKTVACSEPLFCLCDEIPMTKAANKRKFLGQWGLFMVSEGQSVSAMAVEGQRTLEQWLSAYLCSGSRRQRD